MLIDFLYLRTVLLEISLWFGDLWLAASSSCTLSDIPLCRLTMSPQTQRPFGTGAFWVLRSGGVSRVVQCLARNQWHVRHDAGVEYDTVMDRKHALIIWLYWVCDTFSQNSGLEREQKYRSLIIIIDPRLSNCQLQHLMVRQLRQLIPQTLHYRDVHKS